MVVKAKAKTKAAKSKAAKPKNEAKPAVKKEKPKATFKDEAISIPRYITCISGFILVAIVMFLEGILYFECFLNGNGTELNDGLFNLNMWGNRIIGICLVVVAIYGFYKNVYAESLFFLIFAVLALFAFGSEGPLSDEANMVIDILGGILLLIPAFMFVAKRQVLLFITVFLYVFGCIVCEFCNAPADQAIFSIPTLIAAVLMVYIAIAYLVRAETGKTIPLI